MSAEGDDSGARGQAFPGPTETTADSGNQAPGVAGPDDDAADGDARGQEPAPAMTAEDQTPTTGAADAERSATETSATETLAEAGAAEMPVPEAPTAETPAVEMPAAEMPVPEAPAVETPVPEAPADETPEPQSATTEPVPAEAAPSAPEPPADVIPAADLRAALDELGGQVGQLASATTELSRLRSRDTDLIARLHDDVTRLRSGEIAAALNPVVTGMIKLHDQMVSLGALGDPASPVGMLHTQLLQILELTCAVKPFTPAVGDRFDPSHHTGSRRRPTMDASLDGTIAAGIKAGFIRADGSVVRVAEVEVHRLSA